MLLGCEDETENGCVFRLRHQQRSRRVQDSPYRGVIRSIERFTVPLPIARRITTPHISAHLERAITALGNRRYVRRAK